MAKYIKVSVTALSLTRDMLSRIDTKDQNAAFQIDSACQMIHLMLATPQDMAESVANVSGPNLNPIIHWVGSKWLIPSMMSRSLACRLARAVPIQARRLCSPMGR